MKKLVFILIVVITMSFTVNTALSLDLDSNESISTDNQVKNKCRNDIRKS